jgi:hypothetical protein
MALYVTTLCVGLCSGVVGVLVDLDHIREVQGKDHRWLHKWYLLGTCIIICCTIACIAGFLA